MSAHPELPPRIETERLVIRCWSEEDAALLREALDSSLEHLRAWMPWALEEPVSPEETRQRLARFRARFEAAEDFTYAILDRDESRVLGGGGLHRRIGDDGLEIGYWIRADETRRGFATETAAALTRAALSARGITRVQIRCDPENVGSRRIPVKLGYRLVETLRNDKIGPDGEPRDTLVFEITRPHGGE